MKNQGPKRIIAAVIAVILAVAMVSSVLLEVFL